MKSLVFDIETDGLISTKIWCLSALDTETKEQVSFGPDKIKEGVEYLKTADKLIGHNIMGFDIPTITKLTGVDLSDKVLVDTLVLSRLFNPVREGNHGLERWGYALGSPKIEFTEYSKFSSDMLKYCEQDVYLNYLVYKALRQESRGFSRLSIDLEHAVYDIINRQRKHGFLFDEQKASILLATMSQRAAELLTEVHKVFKSKKDIRTIYPRFNPDNVMLKMGVDNFGANTRLTPAEYKKLSVDKEPFVERFYIKEFNPGSRLQIGDYLQKFGWKPKEFTPTGQPKIDEKILAKVKGIPQASLISEFLTLQKRIAQIDSWFKELDTDTGRVHGFVNPNGTITGRMTHRKPNMAQVPSLGSVYGSECRACWTVPKGYKLVGIDASGLELRMLAHYMKDEAYTNEIINGDIHTANQKLAGLESRNQAKTFIYALLYGAGDEKLGSVVGGDKRAGKHLRKSFFDNLPAFAVLKDKVNRASRSKSLTSLDGRKLFVRSEHSALNTLLQGAGAVLMKQALVIFDNALKEKPHIKYSFVANVHDEWQLEVLEQYADEVGKIGVESIKQAGVQLNLNCALDGEYKIGDNWSETH